MEHLIGKVYNEDARESIKVTPKKDIRIKDGMFVFRHGEIYDAIRDQHNNISINAYGKRFEFDSEANTLCFKKINQCSCGRHTTEMFCDRCKSILMGTDVIYDNEFN